MRAGDLNVIFHGQFAFVVHPECVEALTPAVTTAAPHRLAHRYRIGANVLVDDAAASYNLTGVRRSNLTRLPGRNFPSVGPRRAIDRTTNLLKHSIYLPFPEIFTAARLIKRKAADFFTGADSATIDADALPLVYIFSYAFDDYQNVSLDDFWRGADRKINLQIYAEPDRPAPPATMPDNHPVEAFKRQARLFPGLDLSLTRPAWAPPQKVALPHPVEPSDQRSLSEAAGLAWSETPLCVPIVVDNTL